jgi:iron complex transport system substrate-binding protein
MKIISLAPSNTEIVFAIGAGDQVIARTAYCDYPKEALKIPKVGDWVNPDLDEIKRLNPDLILTSTVVQEKLAEKLITEGLPVTHFDPRTLNGVFDSIHQIGELVMKREGAEQLIRNMEDEFHALMNTIEKKKPRLYIEEWHDPPFASGNWVPKLATIAGAEYGLVEEGELSKEVSFEEIKAFDPDIIVLSICGVKSSPELVYRRKEWSDIKAVKSGNVHAFDDSLLNRPGPRLVEGAKQLKKIIFSSLRTSC